VCQIESKLDTAETKKTIMSPLLISNGQY